MKIEKVEKLVTNLNYKNEYVTHIRNLKQALNHGLNLKKSHRVINFNQKTWLKPYIDMTTNLKKGKNKKKDVKKIYFNLMNNAVLEKLWKM